MRWKCTIKPKKEVPKKKTIGVRRFCDVNRLHQGIVFDQQHKSSRACCCSEECTALDGVNPICFFGPILRSIFADLREKEIAYSTSGRLPVLGDCPPGKMHALWSSKIFGLNRWKTVSYTHLTLPTKA